ncbi:MAG: aspartate aminotransferase family protein [Planctomycetota bacterium]
MSSQTQTSRSAELFERAKRVLPGGVSRNTVLRAPHPSYADFGRGCRITDLDGITRLDFSNNMASLIHGHACPEVIDAVSAQVERGTAFMMATEIEVEYAEHLCSRSDSFEKLRFVNSGSEAVLVMLKASRAFTGRPKIAKVEGAYHGGYDYAEVSQAPRPETWGSPDRPNSVPLAHGTPPSALSDVIVLPFNDTQRALSLLDDHAPDLACVLLDLMPHRVGLNPANPEFVQAIRDWTERNGALLVLDEVITFRSEYGGLQSRYNVRPDLTALGKMIGGGFPVGAVAGRSEVLEVMNPSGAEYRFPHSGTFSANPITMSAGLAAMQKFDPASVSRLNALAERAMLGIDRAARDTGTGACVTGAGSMFRVHMKPSQPQNFREAFTSPEENARLRALLEHLFGDGHVMINTCTATLSTPMTEHDIDSLVSSIRSGFEKISVMP